MGSHVVWLWILGAFVAGAVAGVAVARALRRRITRSTAAALPGDVPHVIDLLRRAYQAAGACLVTWDAEPEVSLGDHAPSSSLVERAISVARLAMGDSREHVLREGNVIVAAGDGRMGVALVLGFAEVPPETIEAAVADLRRLLAELRVGRARKLGSSGDAALKHVARTLRRALREDDVVARRRW